MPSVRHIAICLIGLTVSIGQAEPQFPYEVTVGPTGLDARCGPGTPFYVTDHLPAGSTIEVYRREEGGWLAIRPPVNACSWVRKSDLRPTRQAGVAEVVRDDSISCIGSNVVEVRDHLSYVSLHRGELVQMLDDGEHRSPESLGNEWQPIAPPAGEFRWVFVEDLSREQPLEESERPIRIPPPSSGESPSSRDLAVAQNTSNQADTHRAATRDDWKLREEEASPVAILREPTPSPLAGAPPSQPRNPARVQGTVGTSDGSAQTAESLAVQPLPVLANDGAVNQSPVPDRSEADQPLGNGPEWTSRRQPLPGELSELESELALMVARPMNLWRLESLQERTTAMIDKLAPGLERVHAQGLLERIASFEQLQNRYIESGTVPATANAASSATAGDTIATASRHYDGTGWLVPVHASRPVAPPYALLDSHGDILQYVTPAPGLNLYRYVKQKVGVYGQRSFMPSLKKPHVVAERVIDLDRHFR